MAIQHPLTSKDNYDGMTSEMPEMKHLDIKLSVQETENDKLLNELNQQIDKMNAEASHISGKNLNVDYSDLKNSIENVTKYLSKRANTITNLLNAHQHFVESFTQNIEKAIFDNVNNPQRQQQLRDIYQTIIDQQKKAIAYYTQLKNIADEQKVFEQAFNSNLIPDLKEHIEWKINDAQKRAHQKVDRDIFQFEKRINPHAIPPMGNPQLIEIMKAINDKLSPSNIPYQVQNLSADISELINNIDNDNINAEQLHEKIIEVLSDSNIQNIFDRAKRKDPNISQNNNPLDAFRDTLDDIQQLDLPLDKAKLLLQEFKNRLTTPQILNEYFALENAYEAYDPLIELADDMRKMASFQVNRVSNMILADKSNISRMFQLTPSQGKTGTNGQLNYFHSSRYTSNYFTNVLDTINKLGKEKAKALKNKEQIHKETAQDIIDVAHQGLFNRENKVELPIDQLLASIENGQITQGNIFAKIRNNLVQSDEDKEYIDNVVSELKRAEALAIEAKRHLLELKSTNGNLTKQEEEKLNSINTRLERIHKNLNIIEENQQLLGKLTDNIHAIQDFKRSLGKILASSLSLLAISTILHPKYMLQKILSAYTQNGIMFYDLSLAKNAMGMDTDIQGNRDIVYDIGNEYAHQTWNLVNAKQATEMYKGLLANVGASFNMSKAGMQQDYNFMTHHLLADKTLYGISDNNIQQMMKIFYRDMGMDASNSVSRIRKLETAAKKSKTPIDKFITTYTGMVEANKEKGVNADTTLSLFLSITDDLHMRVEDATALLQSTINASHALSQDMARGNFARWLQTGTTNSPFENYNKNVLSHDMYGHEISDYYTTMTNNLFSEQDYYSQSFGIEDGNSRGRDVGITYLMKALKKEGYNDKQASQLVNMKLDGNYEGFKEKLKQIDKSKDPAYEAETTAELSKAITNSSQQMSEFRKIEQTLVMAINEMSQTIEKSLGNPLKHVARFMGRFIKNFAKKLVGIVKFLSKIFDSKIGTTLMSSFANSPFLTTAAIAGGLHYGRKGLNKMLPKWGKATLSHVGTAAGLGIMGSALYDTLTDDTSGEDYGINTNDLDAILRTDTSDWNDEDGDEEVIVGKGYNRLYNLFISGDANAQIYAKNRSPVETFITNHSMAILLGGNLLLNASDLIYKKVLQYKQKINERKTINEIRHSNLNNLQSNKQLRHQTMESLRRIREQNKSKMAKFGRRTNILSNLLFYGTDNIANNPNDNALQRTMKIGIDTSIGVGFDTLARSNNKYARLAGHLGSWAMMLGGSELLNQGIDSLFGGSNNAIGNQQDQIQGFMSEDELLKTRNQLALELGMSTDDLAELQKESLAHHHTSWNDYGAQEKILWTNKMKQYMIIFGNAKLAASMAADYVNSVKGMTIDSNGNLGLSNQDKGKISNASKIEWGGNFKDLQNRNDEELAKIFAVRSKAYLEASEGDGANSSLYALISQYYQFGGVGNTLINNKTEEQKELEQQVRDEIQAIAQKKQDGEALTNAEQVVIDKLSAYINSKLFSKYFNTDLAHLSSIDYSNFLQAIAEEMNENMYQIYYQKQLKQEMSNRINGVNTNNLNANTPDMQYLSFQGGVSYDNAQARTMQWLNYVAQRVYNATGEKLQISAITNGTSHSAGEFSHYNGHKVDVVFNDLSEQKEAEMVAIMNQASREFGNVQIYHEAIGDADNEHYDITVYDKDTGVSNDYLIDANSSVIYGNNGQMMGTNNVTNIGNTRNPFANTSGTFVPKDTTIKKPKTLKEELEENNKKQQQLNKLFGGSDKPLAKGKLLHGVFVLNGEKENDLDMHKLGMQINNNKVYEQIQRDMESGKPVTYMKKNYKFRNILQSVQEICEQYMDDVHIICNVNYGGNVQE